MERPLHTRRVLAPACVLLPLLALGTLALAQSPSGATSTSRSPAGPRAMPRAAVLGIVPPAAVGLGLEPPTDSTLGLPDIATGVQTPAVYHGGPVTGPVEVHTVFWNPGGVSNFDPSYERSLETFFSDVAVASAAPGPSNIFTVLDQYGDVGTPGSYSISYQPTDPTGHDDLIATSDPLPGGSAAECASPEGYGLPTCVTDDQLQAELAHLVAAGGLPTGLGNVYVVYLPPDVDTCVGPNACGTNAFGGYHSLSDLGQGPGTTAIYANIPDPGIEFAATVENGVYPPVNGTPPGGDAGNAIDVSAHELMEAMTDPTGTGWLDPNGNEVADRCERAPSTGVPLGTATNGANFDQVINGDDYLLQEIWSNADRSCVQGSTTTSDGLPLAQVRLKQFSPAVGGTIPSGANGVRVTVGLVRAGTLVASASTRTRAGGSWSLVLPGHAVGDDRDAIEVDYAGAGAPSPPQQTILTGNGGNPAAEAGWTGWSDLDSGITVLSVHNPQHLHPGVLIQTCFQTGVLTVALDGRALPLGVCDTETNAALTPATVRATDTVTVSSDDNRAFFAGGNGRPADLAGGLVQLTVTAPEPGAGGYPTCTADVELGALSCTGLVPKATYSLVRGRAGAAPLALPATTDPTGALRAVFPRPHTLTGGDLVRVVNAAGRAVTALHVADLRVALSGNASTVTSGTCQPGEYVGAPSTLGTTSSSAGTFGNGGPAGTDAICPPSGSAAGLPVSDLSQTDEWSGGQTVTEVPVITTTTPVDGEVVDGSFHLVATAALPGPGGTSMPVAASVAVVVRPAAGHKPVVRAANAATPAGVAVAGLPPGAYTCTWSLIDANGDTRTMTTRFVEEAAP